MRSLTLPKSFNLLVTTLIIGLTLSACGKDEKSTGNASSVPKNIKQEGVLGTWTIDNDSVPAFRGEDIELKLYIEPNQITIQGHCKEYGISAITTSPSRIEKDEIHVLKANKNRVTKGDNFCEVSLEVSSMTFEVDGENKLYISSSDENSFFGGDEFFKRKATLIRTP